MVVRKQRWDVAPPRVGAQCPAGDPETLLGGDATLEGVMPPWGVVPLWGGHAAPGGEAMMLGGRCCTGGGGGGGGGSGCRPRGGDATSLGDAAPGADPTLGGSRCPSG